DEISARRITTTEQSRCLQQKEWMENRHDCHGGGGTPTRATPDASNLAPPGVPRLPHHGFTTFPIPPIPALCRADAGGGAGHDHAEDVVRALRLGREGGAT